LRPVLNTLTQVERWVSGGGPCALHLDTGMTRLGLDAGDIAALLRRRGTLDALELECVMTHLACADEPSHRLNAAQLEAFDALRSRLPDLPTSIGNSAGALLGGGYRGDLVRPGIALYGGNPFLDRPSPVEPVATLSARVLQLREVRDTVTVGYGASYAVKSPARVAVVGFGYADGYLRSLGNCGVASVNGARVPVIGRISMDLLCLDVSAVPTDALREGDAVELIGGPVSLDELAIAAGTISYEILTSIGPRVRREYPGFREEVERQ
jgi:alanine racemase